MQIGTIIAAISIVAIIIAIMEAITGSITTGTFINTITTADRQWATATIRHRCTCRSRITHHRPAIIIGHAMA